MSETPPSQDPRDDSSSVQNAEKRSGSTKKLLKHLSVLFLEAVAVLFAVVFLGLALLAWRLSEGPMNADFLLPHIQKALNNVQGQMQVSIDGLALEWHGWTSPVGLEARDIELSNNAGPFMTIGQADLDVSLTDILRMDVSFRKAVITGLTARVEQRKDGTIRLFNEDDETYGPKARTSPLTVSKVMDNLPPIYNLQIVNAAITYNNQQLGYEQTFRDVTLRIEQSDIREGTSDVSGFLKMSLNPRPQQDDITLDFIYNAYDQNLTLSGALNNTDIRRLMSYTGLDDYMPDSDLDIEIPLQAKGMVVLSNEWRVLNMDMQADTDYGEIKSPNVPDKVLAIEGLNLNMSYDPEANALSLYETRITVAGIDMILAASLALPDTDAAKKEMAGNVQLKLPEIEVDRLDKIIPSTQSDEPLYEWLVEKISKGRFRNFELLTDFQAEQQDAEANNTAQANSDDASASDEGKSPSEDESDDAPILARFASVDGEKVPLPTAKYDWTALLQDGAQEDIFLELDELYVDIRDSDKIWVWRLTDLRADFEYDDLHIDYNPPMMPAEAASGQGSLQGKALALEVNSARLGGMEVLSGALLFDDLVTKGAGNADIALSITTPVKAAFEFLAREPINFGQDLRFDRNQVEGQAVLDVQLNFPTVKDLPVEAVKIDVTGQMTDVFLPGVVNGMALSGGPFDIQASQSDYRMKGRGRLAQTPITLDWHSYFSKAKGRDYESRIQASLTADDTLRQRLDINISDFLRGSVPVDIDLREGWDEFSTLDVKGDLRQATLLLDAFDYSTQGRNDGTLSGRATLRSGRLVRLENLNIDTDQMTLNDGDFDFRHDAAGGNVRLQKGQIERLRFGANDFTAQIQETREGLMKVALSGNQVDARVFLSPTEAEREEMAQSSEDAPSYEVGLDVNRILTHGQEYVRDVDAYLKGRSGKLAQLEVDAIVGQGTLYLRYKPNMEDRYALRLEADDAGAFLRSFGITDKVSGGKMTVAGLPLQRGYYGDVRGLARIDDFSVSAAPTLAGLIKLVDLPTVLTSLNDQGLSFARLETEFEWRNRQGGGMISFKDGRTSGGSMGLTFEGDVNKTLDSVAINGTIVPASTLNSFFSGIPLVGEILSGGSGSIFAATYIIKGSTDDPDVSVNPLSVLAPGIIRRILFEGE